MRIGGGLASHSLQSFLRNLEANPYSQSRLTRIEGFELMDGDGFLRQMNRRHDWGHIYQADELERDTYCEQRTMSMVFWIALTVLLRAT
jgi:hypothetical protein